MKWKYKTLGGHVHVDVFMNGANCGHLCFLCAEFAELMDKAIRSSPSSPIYSFDNLDMSEEPK